MRSSVDGETGHSCLPTCNCGGHDYTPPPPLPYRSFAPIIRLGSPRRGPPRGWGPANAEGWGQYGSAREKAGHSRSRNFLTSFGLADRPNAAYVPVFEFRPNDLALPRAARA